MKTSGNDVCKLFVSLLFFFERMQTKDVALPRKDIILIIHMQQLE